VIGLLLFNTSMQQASFATTALEQQASTLSARQLTLKMELDALRAPQRVADQARRMHMVLPRNPVFLDLRDGSVAGVPAVATPADGQRIWQLPPVKPPVLTPPPTVVDPPSGALTGSKHADAGKNGASRNSHKNHSNHSER
jgi:hypothetical protein